MKGNTAHINRKILLGVIVAIVLVLLGYEIFKSIDSPIAIETTHIVTENEIKQREVEIKKQIEDEVINTIDTPSLDSALLILEW